MGQKILSSVHRQGERFGGDYTAQVLKGSKEQRILENGHDQLSTHGLLADVDKRTIRDWIEQLAGQGFLEKTGEYQVLKITPLGRRLLKGEVTPRLLKPAERSEEKRQRSAAFADSWDDVDRGLFDELRALRRSLAEARGVPPYVIFGDAALRDMARRRPTNIAAFEQVRGVGAKKLEDYGERFVSRIADYCRKHGVASDLRSGVDYVEALAAEDEDQAPLLARGTARASFEHFRQGMSVADVADRLNRAPSTVCGYLLDYIRSEDVRDASPWVDAETARRIEAAAAQDDSGRLKPVFEALGGSVSYEDMRIVLACQRNRERGGADGGGQSRLAVDS
jgi:ATP-dependent DNA helicase RecQ